MQWNKATKRWLPLVKEMERMGFEDYALPELYRSADKQIADLLEACEFVLQELSNMTSDEFAHGADRMARGRLNQAIEKAK